MCWPDHLHTLCYKLMYWLGSHLHIPVCRLRFYVIMTSQRELFPRLTADMRRFKKLPQIHREPGDPGSRLPPDRAEASGSRGSEQDLWEETPAEAAATSAPSDGNEFYPLAVRDSPEAQGLFYPSPLFPLLNNEVASAHRQIQASVEQAMGHCRRDNLWRRLFHGEHLALDKLKLTKLSFSELEELLKSVQSRSVGEIDPQLVRPPFAFVMVNKLDARVILVCYRPSLHSCANDQDLSSQVSRLETSNTDLLT